MNFKGSRKLGVLLALISTFSLAGCGKTVSTEPEVEGIKLNKGAIVEKVEGGYKNINYNKGSYSNVEGNDLIGLYDSESGHYVYTNEDKYFAYCNKKKVELKNIEVGDSGIEISPGGKYISLYRMDDYVTTYKVLNLENGEYLDFNPSTSISGNFVGWINSNSLAYYAVSDEGLQGIYTYNVESNKEELLYKIEGGIVEFLKTSKEGVIILQEDINDERILQVIDSKSGSVTTISKDVRRVYDVIFDGENYYVLGEFNDSVLSIYKIQGEEHIKLVQDFPFKIKIGKDTMCLDEDNNILFIGSNDTVSLEEIYRISKEGSIRKIKDSNEEYMFVR